MSSSDSKLSDTDLPGESLSNDVQLNVSSSVDCHQGAVMLENPEQCGQDVDSDELREQAMKQEEASQEGKYDEDKEQETNSDSLQSNDGNAREALPVNTTTRAAGVTITSDTDICKLRVRDMIKLYNMATERNQELSQTKSMYFGVNRYGTRTNLKGKIMESFESREDLSEVSSSPNDELVDAEEEAITSHEQMICKNSNEGENVLLNTELSSVSTSSDCAAGDPGDTTSTSSLGNSFHLQCEHCQRETRHFVRNCNSSSGFHIMTAGGKSSLTRNGPQKAGSSEIEKAYESKTTIKKTSNGVRIIIDIFFDQDQNVENILNSRVETDIPESRIMTEFHQEAKNRRIYTSHV